MRATTTPALMALLATGVAVCARTAVGAGRRSSVYRRLRSTAPPVAVTASARSSGGRSDAAVPRMPSSPRLPTRPPSALRKAILIADLGVDPEPAWRVWLGSLVVVPVATSILLGGAPALLAAIAVAGGPVIALRARRGRSDARLEAALPEALEAVARSLRSGSSLLQAVEEAGGCTPGPLGDELSTAAARARRGFNLVDALDDLGHRRPLGGVRLAVSALCLGVETGGAQAQAVDGVAATIRDRLGLAAEVRALSSQARASALVMGLAPIGFGAFATATDPRTATLLFHTSLGLAFVTGGIVLDGVGWLWMRRLTRVGP